MHLELFSDKDFLPASSAKKPRKSRDPNDIGESNAPHIFTVSEITRTVRALIESEVARVWVQGEICNHRRQSSGHEYFSIKDERSVLPCVLFNRVLPRSRTDLVDGMLVQVRGEMTVYEPRGQYQLNVSLVQPAGAGLLQAKFEALKRKLEAEGLFAMERKRAIPKFPTRIGVVTSPTGAAIRDMLNIVQRRAPWMRMIINPARVQGNGAAEEIAAAVAEFNAFCGDGGPALVDVIVVCRGGGSAEDLWAFNEELVARAIFASRIPVVSAVGHEIDFTIGDFVADLRAPTPSAAAELVAPETEELLRWITQHTNRLHREITNCLAKWRSQVRAISLAPIFHEPKRRIAESAQRLDHLAERLQRDTLRTVAERKQHLTKVAAAIEEHSPDRAFQLQRHRLEILRERIAHLEQQGIERCRCRLTRSADLLRALSPQNVLTRGYTISTTELGVVVTNPAQVQPGAALITTTTKGKIRSVVS
jgi:exodeoxyribonuclease VII large subunit